MRSRSLQTALEDLIHEVSGQLDSVVADGVEVPMELVANTSRRGQTPLYCYRPMTRRFIREHQEAFIGLEGHKGVMGMLAGFTGLDSYLVSQGVGGPLPADCGLKARVAFEAILVDVFEGQTAFHVSRARLEGAIGQLTAAAVESPHQVTVVGTIYGLAITSGELTLTRGLQIVRPEEMEDASSEWGPLISQEGEGLGVIYTSDGGGSNEGLDRGRTILVELVRALRLYGDGRVGLGAIGWGRIGVGPWRPMALGSHRRACGRLVVLAEQEDEVRAFCNLISRRTPHQNEIAWALDRYHAGCDREDVHRGLSDYLIALRALLEPEGSFTGGLLRKRMAALCASAEEREALSERIAAAIELEQAVIGGSTGGGGWEVELIGEVAGHLRSLLRDVICGHLEADLAVLADEILASEEADEILASSEEKVGEEVTKIMTAAPPAGDQGSLSGEFPDREDGRSLSGEQMESDLCETAEV